MTADQKLAIASYLAGRDMSEKLSFSDDTDDIERSKCPHCGKENYYKDWIWEAGGVVRCPLCLKETMDISYTIPIKESNNAQ